MKLQTILCAAALAATSSFADVTGDNICGLMKIESSLANTIVAVPWVEVGTGDAIKVANLVKTDNLTQGDFLYVYAGGTWYAYLLGADGKWTATTTVGVGGPAAAPAPAEQTLVCGSAVFLQRQDASKPFYVYGQYQAVTGDKQVTAGTVETPVYTLLASPKGEAFNLNAAGAVTGAGANDKIIIPQNGGASLVYSWNGTEWGRYEKQTVVDEVFGATSKNVWNNSAVIGLGTGFWYVSCGGAPVFKW